MAGAARGLSRINSRQRLARRATLLRAGWPPGRCRRLRRSAACGESRAALGRAVAPGAWLFVHRRAAIEAQKPWGDGSTQLTMTRLLFMRRLATQAPRPYPVVVAVVAAEGQLADSESHATRRSAWRLSKAAQRRPAVQRGRSLANDRATHADWGSHRPRTASRQPNVPASDADARHARLVVAGVPMVLPESAAQASADTRLAQATLPRKVGGTVRQFGYHHP